MSMGMGMGMDMEMSMGVGMSMHVGHVHGHERGGGHDQCPSSGAPVISQVELSPHRDPSDLTRAAYSFSSSALIASCKSTEAE